MNSSRLPRVPAASIALAAVAALACYGDRGDAPRAPDGQGGEDATPWITFEHIGAACGQAVEHFQVYAGLVLGGGTVAVGDGGNSVLLCARGTLLGRVGGEGEGPGEFKFIAPNWVAVGSRLAIPDIQLRRVALFSDSGRFERSIPLHAWRAADVSGVLPDQGVVLLASGPDESAVLVVARQNGAVDTLARIRGRRRELTISFPSVVQGRQGHTVKLLTGCSPLVFSAVVGSEIYVVRGDSGVVHRLGDGGLERLYTTDRPSRVTRDDVEALQRKLGGAPSDTVRAVVERYGSVGGISPVVWSRLIVDPDGRLWLGRGSCAEGAAPSTWDVVDTSGVLVGRARIPRMAFQAIRGETALFSWTDSLQVEYVEIFRVRYPDFGEWR